MKIIGFIESISVFGYDRLLSIETQDKRIWCSGLQCNEYLDEGQNSKYLTMHKNVSLIGSLKLVVKYENIHQISELGVFQSKNMSPHASVIGRVLEKRDSFEYVLSIGNDETITVEFEMAVNPNINEIIKVEGELVVELE